MTDFEVSETGTHKALTEKDLEIESLKRRIAHFTQQLGSQYKCAEQAAKTEGEVFAGNMVTAHGIVDVIMRPRETSQSMSSDSDSPSRPHADES